MVLVGVHPSLMQVPPTCSRSISAVRLPAPGQRGGEGSPGLAGADDDRIVPLGSAHAPDLSWGGMALGLGCNDSALPEVPESDLPPKSAPR